LSIKYTNMLHYKTLQNLSKSGFLVWKYSIWQPCPQPSQIFGYHAIAPIRLFTFLVLVYSFPDANWTPGFISSFFFAWW
jgi:hypothetical protein